MGGNRGDSDFKLKFKNGESDRGLREDNLSGDDSLSDPKTKPPEAGGFSSEMPLEETELFENPLLPGPGESPTMGSNKKNDGSGPDSGQGSNLNGSFSYDSPPSGEGFPSGGIDKKIWRFYFS